MTKYIKIIVLFIVLQLRGQQGGMWIPSLLDSRNDTEMKSLGFRLSAKDIYDANQSSLKDAVPHFNGGCSSEVISSQGLLLTNHHCGFEAIQNHSSLDNDYLANGFWAYKKEDELPNEDLVVTFMVKIEDVTSSVLKDLQTSTTIVGKQNKIQQNITAIKLTYPKKDWQEIKILPFYEGNQYILFLTETFRDIRLVGAPPSSIGKFGSDTDNWVWPRHTGDFSLFRIYADKNNNPAEYSIENVPYIPKHFLPISLDGVKEDDFTMVMGYPGKTNEYLPAVALELIANKLNPAKIEIRDIALKVMDSFMRKDNAIKIQYAAKYASTANYWKKWIGESQGIKKSNAIVLKTEAEKVFQEKVKKSVNRNEYEKLLPEFEKVYAQIAPYSLAREYFTEIALRNVGLFVAGYKLYQLEKMYIDKDEQTFAERKEVLYNKMSNFYADYNAKVDEKVFEQLMKLYINKYPKDFLPKSLSGKNISVLTTDIYKNSKITSYSGLKELLSGDNKTILDNLNKDKGYQLLKTMADQYSYDIEPKYNQFALKISDLQQIYMKAQLEINKDNRFFPDANSTLRVTYGKVKGYEPKDGIVYKPKTYLEGVIEKYIPGDYEFDVPSKLIELYNTKNYGQYAENGKMPVCFLGTNHTTGGNSGSPALDAYGNLIGLNFDRVWEGTMSDLYYDPNICRNIMVDARYILFIIDKYANAQNLINEMKLVHAKKK